MKWGDEIVLIRWHFVTQLGQYLEYSSDLSCECVVEVGLLVLVSIPVCIVSFL